MKISQREKVRRLRSKSLKMWAYPIKINHHSGYMHLKVTNADQKTKCTGYSASAVRSDKVLVVISDETMANVFEDMWEDDKKFLFIN
ncbi:hypothetical protein NLX82_20340 [Paenibacillus sp. A3M_27_13]|nr:hypothetical protein [Paenibacillus sp. A3M_27_13]